MVKIRRFDLLVALYIFCIAVSELMGGKTFPLATIWGFHLTASVAILVVPLMFTAVDVVVEVHGRERARSLVVSGLIVIFLLLVYALLATHLPASARFKATEPAYDKIFETSARIAAASLTAFAFSGFLDVFVFNRLRMALKGKALWLRNNLANFVSQFFDTIVFITLAFYAFDKSFGSNFGFLAGIIVPYWILKCIMSIIETPLVYAGVAWLRGEKKAA